MIPLSGRYLAPLAALLVMALVPVAIRHVGGNHGDTCASPAGLFEVSDIPGTAFRRQHPNPTQVVPSAVQWTQGSLRPRFAGGPPLKFELIRAESALDLYAWSRKTLTPDYYMQPAELVPVRSGGVDLPVLIQRNHVGAFAAMLFVEAGRPTAKPIGSSLARAARSPLGPIVPSTVFFVRVPSPQGDGQAELERATDWLRNAWRFYEASCAS